MTTQATALSSAARRQSIRSRNIDASAGATDEPLFNTPVRCTLKGFSALITETFATAGATVSIGSKDSVGAYGSITISDSAAVGTTVTGTVTSSDVSGANLIVVDQTLKSGDGEFIVQLDYETNEAS
jgi:hypothetical protein